MTSVARLLPSIFRRRLRRLVSPASLPPPSPVLPEFHPGGDLVSIYHTRGSVAAMFLRGEGIEIGALHQPLKMPEGAAVKYVDRMTATDLRLQYAELAALPLVDVDIIDDGETLKTLPDAGQDFVVANHFLEHCQDPIRTIVNLFRVLKPGGVLLMAVPDKRWTFDSERPCTTVEHLLRDYQDGPAWSKRGHFEEWSRLVNHSTGEAAVEQEVRHLINLDYSIHFHVWGEAELQEFIGVLRRFLNFELEIFLRNGLESVFVLRKTA
jgi:SAM-dependent methyltransferase